MLFFTTNAGVNLNAYMMSLKNNSNHANFDITHCKIISNKIISHVREKHNALKIYVFFR